MACGDPAPPNVATYDADGSGMDALLVGTLRVTEACVTVEGEDGSPTVPVFPRGEVSTGADGLEFGGRTYADGDRIELGGGEGAPGASAGIPAGCPDVARWVVAPHDG
ncbi:dihydrolipoamide dehydrogenase [Phycicoccus sonneratiae]|uniref:Dihydrolipoamide dehydrogenase n=1 Tax=Phycicoccus sonneratiae TaxID=2807628 RepID=A0ABS2CGL0_9MICO|nr:dihydrolipoamide dehydrogenase [Phycicoccus sonneraticus]MBM6399008.1 dihydrolipoamide dehydrogenase [Phycicoccus sonneraticus]